MHKLDRTISTAPACLANYQYQTHTWDDFGSTCKRELRAALVQMQGIPGITTPVGPARQYRFSGWIMLRLRAHAVAP